LPALLKGTVRALKRLLEPGSCKPSSCALSDLYNGSHAATAQANGSGKAAVEAESAKESSGSKLDVEMKDAAGPAEGSAAATEQYKGQLTGQQTPACSLATSPGACHADMQSNIPLRAPSKDASAGLTEGSLMVQGGMS
jgi:hypothetical protein